MDAEKSLYPDFAAADGIRTPVGSGSLDIRRSVNGIPATLQQITSEHMITNDTAMQAIAAAIGRANNTTQI